MWIIFNSAGEQVGQWRSYQSAKSCVKQLGTGHYAVNTKTGNRIEAAR